MNPTLCQARGCRHLSQDKRMVRAGSSTAEAPGEFRCNQDGTPLVILEECPIRHHWETKPGQRFIGDFA